MTYLSNSQTWSLLVQPVIPLAVIEIVMLPMDLMAVSWLSRDYAVWGMCSHHGLYQACKSIEVLAKFLPTIWIVSSIENNFSKLQYF